MVCFLEPLDLFVCLSQAHELAREGQAVPTGGLFERGDCPSVGFDGFLVSPGVFEGLRQVPLGRSDVERLRPAGPPRGKGPLQELDTLVGVSREAESCPQGIEGPGRPLVSLTESGGGFSYGLAQEGLCSLVLPQLPEEDAQGGEKVDPHLRASPEGVDPIDTGFQELAGRHGLAGMEIGIGPVEQAEEEVAYGLSSLRLVARDPCLPPRGRGAQGQRPHRRHGEGRRQAISPHELGCPVRERVGPGLDGTAFEVPSQIVAERLCRRIPAKRVLLQGLSRNGGQVPLESPPLLSVQPLGLRKRFRIFVQDAFQISPSSRHATEGSPSGEQLVENGSQGVHVGGRGDRITPDLLRSRVFRSQGVESRLGEPVVCLLVGAAGRFRSPTDVRFPRP